MTPPTPETDIAVLRKALAAATTAAGEAQWAFDEPDNWHGVSARIHPVGNGDPIAVVSLSGWGKSNGRAICKGIVEGHNAMPALLAELEALRAERERLREAAESWLAVSIKFIAGPAPTMEGPEARLQPSMRPAYRALREALRAPSAPKEDPNA